MAEVGMFVDDPILLHLLHVYHVETIQKQAQHTRILRQWSMHNRKTRYRGHMLKLGEFLIILGSKLKYQGYPQPCEDGAAGP
jgi:hypothetical protein